jgi:hypothetical protein
VSWLDIKGESTQTSSGVDAGSTFDSSGWVVTTGGSRASARQNKPIITPTEMAYGTDPADVAPSLASAGSYGPVLLVLAIVAAVVIARKRKG